MIIETSCLHLRLLKKTFAVRFFRMRRSLQYYYSICRPKSFVTNRSAKHFPLLFIIPIESLLRLTYFDLIRFDYKV